MPSRRTTLKLPLLGLPALLAPARFAWAAPPRLTLRGPEIVDPNGQPIVLRGWNWGHWNEILPQDAAENVAQGANCVRIPLRWWGKYRTAQIDSRDDGAAATAGIHPGNLQRLDGAMRNASNAKLWIVLFIDSDCGQNGTQPDGRQYCDPTGQYGAKGHNFWTDPAMRRKYVEVWRFVAKRYKDTPYLAMFEPLPETNPPGVPPAQIKAFYAELMSAIREVAPGVPLLIGGRHYKTDAIDEVYDPAWKDVVYTGNLFLHAKARGADDASLANYRQRLKDLVDFRAKHQVPVFVQQVGVRSRDDPDRRGVKEMLQQLVAARIGFTWWTYRGTTNPHEFSAVYAKGNEWVVKRDWMDAITWSFKQR